MLVTPADLRGLAVDRLRQVADEVRAEGIGAVVFDGAMSAYAGGGLSPVRLMVLAEDLARARAALAA